MSLTINNQTEEQWSADYVPPTLTDAEVREIVMGRAMGHYQTKQTRDEAIVCVRQMKENPKDIVSTLIRRMGVFNCYNEKEFNLQLKGWKTARCRLRKCNIKEVDCGKEGKAWLFTVQPPPKDLEKCGLCPLAMSFGIMVSGYSYLTLNKSHADKVWDKTGGLP